MPRLCAGFLRRRPFGRGAATAATADARRPGSWSQAGWPPSRSVPSPSGRRPRPTTAASVVLACHEACSRDPVVQGLGAREAAAAGTGCTSEQNTAALRRRQLYRFFALLPSEALARAAGLSPEAFAAARSDAVAEYLFARAGLASPGTISQARFALVRLLRCMHAQGVAACDRQAAGYSGRSRRLARASFPRESLRLPLPTAAVKAALPAVARARGQGALLQGAVPLPPEALAMLRPTSAIARSLRRCAPGPSLSISRP